MFAVKFEGGCSCCEWGWFIKPWGWEYAWLKLGLLCWCGWLEWLLNMLKGDPEELKGWADGTCKIVFSVLEGGNNWDEKNDCDNLPPVSSLATWDFCYAVACDAGFVCLLEFRGGNRVVPEFFFIISEREGSDVWVLVK